MAGTTGGENKAKRRVSLEQLATAAGSIYRAAHYTDRVGSFHPYRLYTRLFIPRPVFTFPLKSPSRFTITHTHSESATYDDDGHIPAVIY